MKLFISSVTGTGVIFGNWPNC